MTPSLLPSLLAALLLAQASAAPAAPPQSPREDFHLHDFEAEFAYAQAIRIGDRLLVSGTVSVDAQGRTVGRGDMRAQLRQVYATLARTLAHHGTDLSHVIKETVYTTQMPRLLAAAQERARAYRDASATRVPTSSWIGVQRLVSPDYWVEVEVEAVIPASPAASSPER